MFLEGFRGVVRWGVLNEFERGFEIRTGRGCLDSGT